MNDIKTMPLICLRCKKDIPLSMPTFEEVSYTHYSYCEECLRKGLKALKSWDELYKRIYDHNYEIIRMEDSEVKRAKLSLINWVLDLMNSDLDYEYRTEVEPQENWDIQKNIKGEWIKTTITESCGTNENHEIVYRDVPTYACSKCGNPLTTYQWRTRFCPNCGADMRGENNGN